MKLRPLFFVPLLPLLALDASAATVTWDQPNANNNWNTTDLNWLGGVKFTNLDNVIFNTATGESVAVLAGGVTAGTIEVGTNNGSWTFSGGAISGALTKNGTGTLTLSSANAFSSIALNGGGIILGNAGGMGTGTVTMGTGVSTTTTTSSMLVTTSLASGSIITTNLTLPTGDAAANTNRALYMKGTSNAAITLELSGKISGGSANARLYLNNDTSGAYNPQFIFSNNTNDFRANILINRGGIRITSNEALGNTANTVTFDSNSGADVTFLNAMTYTRATNMISGTDFDTGSNAVTASGVISGGGYFNKIGTGTLTLTAADTFTGASTVTAGTLVLSGTNGALTGTSGMTISAGTTLRLDNATNNNTNRLKDAAAIGMSGAAIDYVVAASGAYSETAGALTLSGVANTITAGQATSGTSVLTFASLTRSSGFLNFIGSGLGASINTTNEIRFTTAPTLTNGIIGAWAMVNGTDFATMSGNNVVAYSYDGSTDVTRLESGTKTIADDATKNVQIIDGTGSSPAAITLAAATTNIYTLKQSATGGAVTIDAGTNTLRLGVSGAILAPSGSGALTIGTTANQGNLTAGGSAVDVAGAIDVTGNSAVTINSKITNNGAGVVTLTKSGSDMLSLAGTNTFTGATSIFAGTLQISGAGQLGSGTYAATITNNGTLQYSSSSAQTLSGVISGTGSLTYDGSGTLTLSGVNTYTGATTIGTGTLVVGSAGQLGSGSYGSAITNNGTLQYSSSAGQTLSGAITGSGSLLKDGSGLLTLTGINGYSGGTTLNNGTLQASLGTTAGAKTAFGSGTITAQSGTILEFLAGGTTNAMSHANNIALNGATLKSTDAVQTYSGTVALTGANTIQVVHDTKNAIFSNTISGTGSLAKTGAGMLVLSGSNGYSGGTTLSAGTLRLTNTGAIGSGDLTISAGQLQFAVTSGSTSTMTNNISLPTAGSSQLNILAPSSQTTVRLTGKLSGGAAGQTYRLVDSQASGNHNNVLILDNATNDFIGTIEMWRGTLAITSNAALGNADNDIRLETENLNGALRFDADNITLAATRSIILPGAANIRPIDTQGYNATIEGVISGTGLLTKIGSGTLTLTAANTNSNTTTVSAGTLLVNNTNVVTESGTGTGSVAVSAGATLGGTGRVAGATTISGNLNAGNGGTTKETLAFGSTLNLTSAQKTTFDIAGATTRGTDYDGIDVTGALTYGGILELNFASVFAGGTYNFDLFNLSSQTGSFSAVNLIGAYTGSLTNSGGLWSLSTGGNTWQFTQSTGDLAFTAVPEPTSAVAGLLLGAGLLRRRPRHSSPVSIQ